MKSTGWIRLVSAKTPLAWSATSASRFPRLPERQDDLHGLLGPAVAVVVVGQVARPNRRATGLRVATTFQAARPPETRSSEAVERAML